MTMRAAMPAPTVAAMPPVPAWRVGAVNDTAEHEADRVAVRILAGLSASPARHPGRGVLRREGEGRSVSLPTPGEAEAVAAAALAEALALLAEGEAIAAAELARIAALVDGALATIEGEALRAAAAAWTLAQAALLRLGEAVVTGAAGVALTAAGALVSLIRALEAIAARAAALPEDLAALAREAGRLAEAGVASATDWADALADAAGLRAAPAESHRVIADREAARERAGEAAGVLPPIGSVCGPDVEAPTTAVWTRVQADFAGWTDAQKCSACGSLVNPIVAGAASIDPSMIGSGLQHLWETGNVVEGGQVVLMGLGQNLNRDAFDTLGLYLGSASYLRARPYSPPCGQPPSPNPAAAATDHVHEDPSTCATTVELGSECWVSGTANYGTYGIMMRACHDWLSRGGACVLPAALFTRTATIVLVQAYKRLDDDDPEPPTRWAVATYDGGPVARASGGNRPNCPTDCPDTNRYQGGPFSYVWEPVMPRVGWAP